MDYDLDSHADFTEEQEFLVSVANKKAELEKKRVQEEREFDMRFKVIKGYFSRLSWRHKKNFILTVASQCNSLIILVRVLSYASISFGKLSSYADVKPNSTLEFDQIIIDHDRTLGNSCLRECEKDDLNWIACLDKEKQLDILLQLMMLGGESLIRKLYFPLLNLYNRCILKEQEMLDNAELNKESDLEGVLNAKKLDDTDKYPQDHPMSIEVAKLRKKWDDLIEKYRQELFPSSKTMQKDNRVKKQEKKAENPKKNKTKGKNRSSTSSDVLDWISILPVWIVKKIFGYFDTKTLQILKKVNSYWSYVSDGLIKDRQTRKFLDETLEKLIKNVDSDILKQCEVEDVGLSAQNRASPTEKRLKKLSTRGAILNEIRPKIRKSEQVQYSATTSIPQSSLICTPLNMLTTFPRMVKENLLMYKEYPCLLKDVNILINVEEDIQKQRSTLYYSLSGSMSDTFSMSEITLTDW